MQIFNTNKNKVINEPIFDAILNANNTNNDNDYYPFNLKHMLLFSYEIKF